MAGFADLVEQAQPALVGGGVTAEATEGRNWKWIFEDVVDSAGAVIDLSTTTGVCKVWTKVGGTEVVTLDYVGAANGTFTVSKVAASTAALAATASAPGRSCVWGLTITSGTTQVQVWGPSNSVFTIRQEA